MSYEIFFFHFSIFHNFFIIFCVCFYCRYCISFRFGATATTGTAWTAETSVLCKVAAGADGSILVQISVGSLDGSWTDGATYDIGIGSDAMLRNTGKTSGGSLSVSGAGFGMSR